VVKLHHRVSQPRPTKRATQLRVVRHRHHERAPGRVSDPLRRPARPRPIRAHQHHVRQIRHKLRGPLLVNITDGHSSAHATIPTIPQSRRRLRTVRLNLHRHLARATARNRHQRHTMSPRRQHRLPKLQSKSVAYENLVKLERVIRTRQPQPLELRTHRRLPHRLSRPAKNRLRPLQLRGKSDSQILKRLLGVVVQRPLNILAQPGTPPLQNLTNGRQLVIGNISNPQIPNVLTSPRRHLPPPSRSSLEPCTATLNSSLSYIRDSSGTGSRAYAARPWRAASSGPSADLPQDR